MPIVSSNPIATKKVFITGATSGIGYSLSKKYLLEGWDVIGLGRNENKIINLKNDYPNNFQFIKIDISQFDQLKENLSLLFQKNKDIDTFILNAGIYIPESFQDYSFSNAKKMFDVNVLSIYLILDILKKYNQLNSNQTLGIVSSVAGYRGLPKSILYGPTKAALINLCESLRIDLAKNVNIKLINPGFVDTPATKVNSFKMPFIISAEKAANIIFNRIYKKGFEISFPFPFNLIMKFGSILPYGFYFKLTKNISKR